MSHLLPPRPVYRFWLLLAALLIVALVYVFEVDVDVSARRFQQMTADGGRSDLYPYWLGGRILVFERQSPYSAAGLARISAGEYGANQPTDAANRAEFYYPIFAILPLYPLIYLPFNLAAWLWSLLLLLLTAVSIYVWSGLIGWPQGRVERLSVAVLALGFIGVTNNFFLQQVSGLLLPALALFYWALRRGYYFLAGSAAAILAIKPQLALLLLPALIFWAAFGWRADARRVRLLLGLAATLLTFEIGAEMLLPGWLGGFLVAVRDYTANTGGDTLLVALGGSALLNVIVSAVLVGLAVLFWWQVRQSAPADYRFTHALCFSLAATYFIIPTYALYNMAVLILPGILLCFATAPRLHYVQQRVCLALLGLGLAFNYLAQVGLAGLYLLGAANLAVANKDLPALMEPFLPILTILCLLAIAPPLLRVPPHPTPTLES